MKNKEKRLPAKMVIFVSFLIGTNRIANIFKLSGGRHIIGNLAIDIMGLSIGFLAGHLASSVIVDGVCDAIDSVRKVKEDNANA